MSGSSPARCRCTIASRAATRCCDFLGHGDASGLQKAFGAIGAPFAVLDLDGEAARQVYGFDYLLVRRTCM
jgi:hypothetical protein